MTSKKVNSRFSYRPVGAAGFGLVEVMIAAAMISIIALGIGTLIDDMMKAQKKTNTSAAIGAMRARIMAAVQNGEAWSATSADATRNPEMDCMRPGVATCDHNTPVALSLLDAAGGEIYYGEQANHGFNYDGVTCVNYPNNDCVFRWNLTWRGICPGGVACRTPAVIVTGVLEHTPGDLTMPTGINYETYGFVLQRGTAATRSDPVTLSYIEFDNSGEGLCLNGTPNWSTRKLSHWGVDPGNNLLNKGTGQALNATAVDRVSLRAGTYNCRIQAPAFKNGGNRLRLVGMTGSSVDVQSSSATASQNGGSAVLLIETTLILDTDTVFRIEQRCDSNPSLAVPAGFGSTNDSWSLGVPVPDNGTTNYTSGVTYTTVACTRTS